MLNQLLVARWISSSFPVIRTILMVTLTILALILIVLVFMQIGNSNASNVLTGNQDSYYSQNKGNSREGRITRWIYICVGIIALICIVYFITLKIYKG